MSLMIIPQNVSETFVVQKFDAESGKETVKLVSCKEYGEKTGLRGKELNRAYDRLKTEFNGAFKAAAHSAIDRMRGVSLQQSKTRFSITLERPKNSAADLRRQAEALLAQAADLETAENTLEA